MQQELPKQANLLDHLVGERRSNVGGTLSPSAFAVLRLITI